MSQNTYKIQFNLSIISPLFNGNINRFIYKLCREYINTYLHKQNQTNKHAHAHTHTHTYTLHILILTFIEISHGTKQYYNTRKRTYAIRRPGSFTGMIYCLFCDRHLHYEIVNTIESSYQHSRDPELKIFISSYLTCINVIVSKPFPPSSTSNTCDTINSIITDIRYNVIPIPDYLGWSKFRYV